MAVRLGDLLVREKRLTPAQLQGALTHQREHGGRLGSNLVKLGLVSDDDISTVLSRQFGVPAVDLADVKPDPGVLRLIPAEKASKYQAFPVAREGTTLTLAMADPTNVFAMDDVKFITGLYVEPVVASEAAIADAIERYYGKTAAPGAPPARTNGVRPAEASTRGAEEPVRAGGLEAIDLGSDTIEIGAAAFETPGAEAPAVRLVNALMLSAVQRGASDIHVEPYEQEMRVRFRIDGVLHPVMSPPLKLRDAVISRIKIMARLDIAEKRLPQDGRIKARYSDHGQARELDLRVSVLPTLFGEKIVMRLLDRERLQLDMTQLGFEPGALARFEAAIRRPWGLVLVTGPTGSGKTNTLYSSIARLNQPGINILTVEDPVEFNLGGINQVQVREQIGLTFAAALRSFLRQDPNVILVGEIRDPETASIAVKAALTGHLVLSTLHTNDAPSSINRLVNMGVEPFLVANSVNLVCAQRLVRRVCSGCREPDATAVDALVEAGLDEATARAAAPVRGHGCDRCNGTGFRGRVGLFEVMEVTDAMRALVVNLTPADELRRHAVADGMVTLRQSGLRKVAAGITTIEEVVRETV